MTTKIKRRDLMIVGMMDCSYMRLSAKNIYRPMTIGGEYLKRGMEKNCTECPFEERRADIFARLPEKSINKLQKKT